jgi:branched-chain amino acid transport system substrate-binding protein
MALYCCGRLRDRRPRYEVWRESVQKGDHVKRKRILLALVFALVVAVAMVAVACGSGDETSSSTTAAPSSSTTAAPASSSTTAAPASSTTVAAKPIRIGTSLPLTGARSVPGIAAKQGYEVWADMINASGGLLGRKVELVVKDDASDQNIIVADYNALISQDKVDLLLGTFSSALVLPSSAVAEKNNMLYVTPAGASPEIYSRGFTKVFMSQQSLAPDAGKAFANYIAALPADQRPKTMAVVTIDDPFTAPVVQGIQKILEAAGVKTVYTSTYPEGTTDFDSIVNAMKGAKPDLLASGAVFEDGVALVRAMLKAGFTPAWLYQTTAPGQGDQYSQAIGVENTEGIFYHVSYAEPAKTPGNAEFVKRYREMFGTGAIAEDTADAFAAAQVLAAAVTAVGNLDQTKLADYLHTNKVETILGPLSWDAAGKPLGDMMIGQWQSGVVQVVLPPVAATTQTIIQGWKPGTK